MLTPERKQRLLLEARRDRIAWIKVASSPFRVIGKGDPTSHHPGGGRDEDLLRSLSACRSLPSAVNVVKDLYRQQRPAPEGLEERIVAERISKMVEENATNILSATSSMLFSIDSRAGLVLEGDALEEEEFVSSYRDFILRLQSTQCAQLVQKIRAFVTSQGHRSIRIDELKIVALASSINEFLDSICEDFRAENSDSALAENPGVVRQCLETFLYAQLQHVIWPFLTSNMGEDDEGIQMRFGKLQYVTPSHLEIACLSKYDVGNRTASTSLEDEALGADGRNMSGCEALLTEPVEQLKRLHTFHSPTKVVDCVLEVYKGINHALSSTKASPGADDVLPTFILVLLRARPKEIISMLRFVETFVPPSSLRGEAGYAFMSLFSAVEYVRQLDFNQFSNMDQTIKDSLVTGTTDFRVSGDKSPVIAAYPDEGSEEKAENAPPAKHVSMRASDVRFARERNEMTDLSWAQRWSQLQNADGGDLVLGESDTMNVSSEQTNDSTVLSSLHSPGSPLQREVKQNNDAVKLFSRRHFTEAMALFQAAVRERRIASVASRDTNCAKDQWHGTNGVNENGDGQLMRRLDHLFATLNYTKVSTDRYVYQRDCYDEGMATFSDLLLMDECGNDVEMRVVVLHYNMALVAVQLKRFKEAYDYFYVALSEAKANKMASHHERNIAILHNLGRVLYFLGRYEDSLAVFEAALGSGASAPDGGNLLHIASTKTCIGCVKWRIVQEDSTLLATERAAKGREILHLHLDALSMKESILDGGSSSSIAVSLNHLGCIYGDENLCGEDDGGKAMEYFQRCLKMRRSLPRNHPDVAQVLYNIARIHHSTGAVHQALDLYAECLRGLRLTLGRGHRDVSAALLCMAWIYRDTGRDEEALKCCKEALESGKAAFGDTHTQVGMIWCLLGHVYQTLGERDESSDHTQSALTAFSESIRVTRAIHGENHHRIPSMFVLIGDIQKTKADYDAAICSYQNALPLLKRSDEVDPFELATTLNSLGYCYAVKGELMDAVKVYTAAVNLRLDEGDERQVVFAHAFHSLGVIFTKLERKELAKEALQESERIRKVLRNQASCSPVVFEQPMTCVANPEDSPHGSDYSAIESKEGMRRIASRDSQLVAQLIGSEEEARDKNQDSVVVYFLNTLDKIRDSEGKKRTTMSSEIPRPIRKQ